MLQNIRQYTQGPTAKIVVGLIVISFALFGIESILLNGGGNKIAEVNGKSISPQELQHALDTQRQRLMSVMGDQIDPAMLEDEHLRPQVLETLINRTLLTQSAQSMKLAISEKEIGTVVAGMEQFQVDGAFSPDLYKSVLASAGYTPGYFKQSLREDMLLSQLRNGLMGSEFVTPSELELNSNVIAERRDLRYFTIPQDKFAAIPPVTDAQIEAYYKAHQEDFRSPESVDIDYIELSQDDFRQPVAESDILEAFELAKQDNQFKPQNRVSHILFESGSGDDVQQRVVKAQEKLSAGVAFAEVAKEFSDDVGSANKGGDLGYSSGDAFPEEMEAAIAQLKPGIVSDPIVTKAGTHLILVTEQKKGEEPKLEDMRQQLQEKIQTDEAHAALLKTVESLKDLAFNAEDLAYPAKELSLTIKQVNSVTRMQKEGLLSSPAVLAAAFSEDVVSSGNNSDVIEVPGDKFVVLRVRNHHLPEIKPLATVREEVAAAVTDEEVRAAVVTEANHAMEQMRAGVALDQFANTNGYKLVQELGVDRRNSTVPPEVLRRGFELPPTSADHSSTDYITTANGDAFVIESELGLGTVVRALTAYEKEHLRICRPRGLGYHDSQKVLAYAIRRLGTTYDVRQVFDLARFLFPWVIMPRRWRSTLFSARPGKSTQTVCSTMIAEAFGHIQFPILPLVKRVVGNNVQLYMRNPKLCTPSDFDYSPYFDIIKYPFLDFHHYADQRLLPWQGAANLSEQEREMYVTADQDLSFLPNDTQ